MLYLDLSAVHGRGVFTRKWIGKGVIFHAAPIVRLAPVDLDLVAASSLGDTLFAFPDGGAGMILSPFAMVNHSRAPNADYTVAGEIVRFRALQDINPGDELLIDYGDFATVLGIEPRLDQQKELEGESSNRGPRIIDPGSLRGISHAEALRRGNHENAERRERPV